MKKHIINIALCITISTISFAQEASTVHIARNKIYSGAMGQLKIFIDEKLSCEINNNSYSTHNLSPGKHTFSVQWGGKEEKENASEKRTLEIECVAGKTYYLKIIKEQKNMILWLYIEEISQASWQRFEKSLKPDCL
jgi:hypothetical protein